MAKITVSSAIKALLSAANEAAARIALGLGNVQNTSDANKPVSTATQTALDLKAPLASPALTGVPTAPTAAAGTSTTQIATTAFVATAIGNLLDSAPSALDTLNELAAALGDDANFAGTVTASLAGKAPLASPALTGVPTAPTAPLGTSTTQLASTAFVVGEISARCVRYDAAQTLNSSQITQARANIGIGFGWVFGEVNSNSSIWVGSGRFFVHNGPNGQEVYLDPTGRRITYNSVAGKNAHLVFPEVGVLDPEPTFTLRLAGGTFAFLEGDQTFTGTLTVSDPIVSTGSPTLGTHLINRDQSDARYGEQIYLVKPTNTDRVNVSATSRPADPHLTSGSLPAGTYHIQGDLYFTASANAPGYYMAVEQSNGTVLPFSAVNLSRNNHSNSSTQINRLRGTIAGDTFPPINAGAADWTGTSGQTVGVRGIVRLDATGTISIRWGQNTPTSDTTSLLAGSYLIIRRVL